MKFQTIGAGLQRAALATRLGMRWKLMNFALAGALRPNRLRFRFTGRTSEFRTLYFRSEFQSNFIHLTPNISVAAGGWNCTFTPPEGSSEHFGGRADD